MRVQLLKGGEVVKSFWCLHLDVDWVRPILLFRVLEASGLAMTDSRLEEWSVVTSDGWRFNGFEKLDDPKESRCV